MVLPLEPKSVEEVYLALRGQGRLEWIGQSKSAAALYFTRGRREYKIYFDESNVEISQKKRLWKHEYWDSLGQRRYINPEDTVSDVYDTVMWCLREYGRKEQDSGDE